eukprot:Tbor_TRINITY_DN5855_c1_g1::TRINITY_DN5855_c1_g1_i15::g.6417::m.6417
MLLLYYILFLHCQSEIAAPLHRREAHRSVSNALQQTTQAHEGAADTNGRECPNPDCKFKGTKKFTPGGSTKKFKGERGLIVHLNNKGRSCRPDLFESLKRQRAEATERKDSKRPRSELLQPADPPLIIMLYIYIYIYIY